MSAEAKPDILDASLLRVPFEALKRAAKDRKAYVDETGDALNAIENASSGSTAEQMEQLDQLVARLQGLKRKLQEAGRQEAMKRCAAKSDWSTSSRWDSLPKAVLLHGTSSGCPASWWTTC